MGADPSFHCAESMRMAMRDRLFPDLGTDSVTSPEKMVFLGNTVPSTKVATWSLAWSLVPTGVLPAVTSCFMVTGNSMALAGAGGAGPSDDGLIDDEPGAGALGAAGPC